MKVFAAALILVLAGTNAFAGPVATSAPVPSGPSPPAAAPPSASPAHDLTTADLGAWLDGLVPFAIGRGDIAGAEVVVVKDGKVLVEKGYGVADVKTGRAVDPARTLFRPGSISKLFTWTAVMQLVEQKKLDLDTDVNTYLDFTVPHSFGKPVTLREIMTHRAGFEEAIKRLFTEDPKRMQSLGAGLKAWVPEQIFPPGDRRPIPTMARRLRATSSSACRARRSRTISPGTSSRRSA